HLDDLYTYSNDRHVYVSMNVPGQVLGWGTWVYPDSSARITGVKNSDFYFGSAPITGVPNGPPLVDGAVWSLNITVDRVGQNDFFGFRGPDGGRRVESPRGPGYALWTSFKAGLSQTATVKFAVSPE